MRSLPRSSPEAQGVGSDVLVRLVEALDRSASELHSLMVVRHGQVIAEAWWSPYAAEIPHDLYSVSKSFTSAAVGMLVAEGKLSVDDPVISFFPNQQPDDIGDNLAAMRVRHLLTMTTGHTREPMMLRADSSSGVERFLAAPVEHQPGTQFVYSSPATYVLSAIVQTLTGVTLLEFLTERLFAPLGITDATWPSSDEGITYGGFGLSLTTESLARFGQLLLDNGGDLIPADWLAEATRKQVPTDSAANPDGRLGYGYQFWPSRHGYRADGAFGQLCLVLPESDALVVITAASRNTQEMLDIVWSELPGALENDVPLPADAEANRRLTDRIARLELPPPDRSTEVPAELAGRTYVVDNPDAFGLERIVLGPRISVTIGFREGSAEIVCGPGTWQDQTIRLGDLDRAVASAVWAEDRLVVTIRFTGTPFCQTFECRFDDGRVRVDGSSNVVSGNVSERTHQTGRRA